MTSEEIEKSEDSLALANGAYDLIENVLLTLEDQIDKADASERFYAEKELWIAYHSLKRARMMYNRAHTIEIMNSVHQAEANAGNMLKLCLGLIPLQEEKTEK